MSEIIDLDALVPQEVTIKFGGEDIKVKPPTTGDVIQISFLFEKLKANQNSENINEVIDQITKQIQKCIPELEGKELNTAQILSLVQIISNLAMPQDAKELEAKGISTTDPKAPQG